MSTTSPSRTCEHCKADIGHKRRDARFCNRTCKMADWHATNRATPEGKAREKVRNTSRYATEAPRRRAGAIDYYWRNQELRVQYAREWRAENPHRRRRQAERRADLMISNPGFAPFGSAEWEALKRRHGNRCAYCDVAGLDLCKDHVIPLSRGGRHAIANILPACRACNGAKSDMLLAEWRRCPTYPRR